MVLCAGFGTRLGDLTREIPKPMLPLNERPILEYILANLRAHGFNEIGVTLHFRPEIVRGHFGDGSKWGVSIVYSDEERLMGTAGGVKKMEAFLRQSDPFLVHYGDIVTDQDFTAMLQCHRQRRALATLLLHQRAKSNSVVTLDGDSRIVGFLERPTDEARRGVASSWVNSGICLCSPEILEHIEPGVACDLPRDIFTKLVPTGRLFGFPLSGYRCAIDSPERLAEARAAIAENRCRVKMEWERSHK